MTKPKAKAIPKDKNARTLYRLLSGSHSRKERSEWVVYQAPCDILLTTDEWWALKGRVRAAKTTVIINPFEGREDAKPSE